MADDQRESMDCDSPEDDIQSLNSSSSDDDDALLREKILQSRKQVDEWPLYYDGHVTLIKSLHEAGELVEARQARETMNKHYPLSPELWLEWIRDEQSVCTTAEERAFIVALFERAVKDYASVEVWLEYLLFTVGGGDLTVTREVAERALTAVGTNVRDGSLIWQAVFMVELQVYASFPASDDGQKSEAQHEQAKRLQNLIRRRLRVPLLNIDEEAYLADIQQWFGSDADPSMTADLSKTFAKLKEKEPFEDKLLQTEKDGAANVAAFEEYLKHTKEHAQPTELQNLYERAVLKHPCNEGLWRQYADWCCDQFGRCATLVVPITERARRNCPWSGVLCAMHVSAVQRCAMQGHTPLHSLQNNIKEIVEASLFSLSAVDSRAVPVAASDMWLCYVEYLVRCLREYQEQEESAAGSTRALTNGSRDSVKIETQQLLDKLRRACHEGIDMIRKAASEAKVACEGDIALTRIIAELEASVGNIEEARVVWNDLLAQASYTGRHDIWLQFIHLERRAGDVKHTRKLFRRALERVWERTEEVAEAFRSFEQTEGDFEAMDDFRQRFKNRMVIVTKRRVEMQTKEEQKKGQFSRKKEGKGGRPAHSNAASVSRSPESKHSERRMSERPSPMSTSPAEVALNSSAETSSKDAELMPPPGFPGNRPSKRLLEEPEDTPTKKVKNESAPWEHTQSGHVKHVAKGQESCTVFVSNLAYTTTISEVVRVLSDCGTVKDANLVKDYKGRSKGFGFVVFENQECTSRALKKDRTLIGTRPMFVSSYESEKQGHHFQYSTGLEKDKLFVRGLPQSMTEQQIQEEFEKLAPVSEIRLVCHRNGYSKGVCFIKYANATDAEKVRKAMDQTALQGHTITVLISDPSAARRQQNSSPSKVDKISTDSSSGSSGPGTSGGGVASRKPKLAFIPRSVTRPSQDTKPPTSTNAAVESTSAPAASKSNDDFRKMLLK